MRQCGRVYGTKDSRIRVLGGDRRTQDFPFGGLQFDDGVVCGDDNDVTSKLMGEGFRGESLQV